MPFRKKLKRALGGSSSADYDISGLTSQGQSKKMKNGSESNVYQPGESMPRSKYRGPWNQAHQEKLSAFSFGSAWKRTSSEVTIRSAKGNSDYSPMGSRLPSRGPSRRGSTWSTFSFRGGKRAWGMGSREASKQSVPQQSVEEEHDRDDTDVRNVGLSRAPTRDRVPAISSRKEASRRDGGEKHDDTALNGHADPQSVVLPLEASSESSTGQLFTAEELAKAMSKSTLERP